MTNNPTIYEQILSYGFRKVEFTKCHRWTETITMFFSHGALGDNNDSLVQY
jgi:hypothetical protein